MIFFSYINHIFIFSLFYFFNYIFYLSYTTVNYGVDYIFTEFSFSIIIIYSNTYEWISYTFMYINLFLSTLLPFIVSVFIGYCHFYYQLGYGLIFYIYLFRRYKAKKTKNWKHFYGNSILNWIFFYISTLNKFYLNKNFLIFIKNKIWSIITTIKVLISVNKNMNVFFKKWILLYKYLARNFIKYSWTPVFKRSSYISFLNLVKRFVKRK